VALTPLQGSGQSFELTGSLPPIVKAHLLVLFPGFGGPVHGPGVAVRPAIACVVEQDFGDHEGSAASRGGTHQS